jgi:hypothetical protein
MRRVLLSVVCVSMQWVATAWSDEASTQLVSTVDDPDLAAQGEYASGIAGASGSTASPMGLQVVAWGGGQFRGALYAGGLPGNRARSTQHVVLEGQRGDGGVVLSGGDYAVVVQGPHARLSHTARGDLGTLVKVVRRSPYAGLAPPPGAIVLFDGHGTKAFQRARVKDGLLQVGTELVPTFRNYQLHVEFQVPFMPTAREQGRGNSGVYLQSRYEVQVLDSFGLEGVFNECGALYRQRAPDLNMAFPPLTWQTYDITFHSPTFDACGNKCRDARLTVLHNGVRVHNNVRITGKTGAGQPEGPQPLPIKFQDHGNPVQFRNIWLREL